MTTQATSSDNQLARQLADGDRAALGELIRRWHGPLRIFAEGVCQRADLAEEACQELWIRIVRYRQRLTTVRDMRAYLFATTLNCCRTLMARRGRHKTFRLMSMADDDGEGPSPADEIPDTAPAPLERLITREQVRLLNVAVAKLPEMQRAVVLMYLHGTTDYRRIAAALGIRTATARSHMHRALKHLRETLGRIADRTDIPIETLRREVSS